MRLLVSSLFFLTTLIALSQDNLEQLHSIWSDQENSDSMRLEALDDYIWEGFLYQKPDSAFNLALVQYVMAKRSGNVDQTGNALANLGQSKLFEGDLDQAEKFAHKNLSFTKSVKDTMGLTRAYNLVGMVYNDKMNYSKSKAYFDTCIAIAKHHGQNDLLTKAYHNIGVLYSKFSNYDAAIKSYRNSLKIEQSLGDIRGTGMTNKQIANVYFNMGNFSAAYEIYLDIIDVCKEAGNLPDLYAETCSDLGNLLHEQGDLERSAKYYLKSIAIAKENGYVITEAISSVNLGTNYNEEEKHEDALRHFKRALVIFRDVNHHYGEGVALTNIGEVNTILHNYDTARVYLNEGFEIFLAMENFFGMASSYNYLANLYLAQKDFDKSIQFGNRSLKLSKKYQLHEQRGLSYEVLYEAYFEKGDLERCIDILNEIKAYRDKDLSVNYFTMSETQKDLYFRSLEQDYHNYFDFAVSNKDRFPQVVDSCFNIALRTKGLSLKSTTALRKEILNNDDEKVKELYNELIQLKEEIAAVYARGEGVEELEKKATTLERELIRESESFSSFDQLRKVTWKSLQKELKRDESVVEFIHFTSSLEDEKQTQYAAFVLQHKGDPVLVPLCYETELEQLLNKKDRNDIQFIEDLYTVKDGQNTLYKLIWKPIATHLGNAKKIFIAPSGLLHKVSFASIPSVKEDIRLCQQYELFQNNSNSSILDRAEAELDKNDRFLLVGGVQYSSDATEREIWSYLPGTLKETDQIEGYLQNSKYAVNYLTNKDATEENFKSAIRESNFVHVATHGFFYPDPKTKVVAENQTEVVEEVNFRGATNYARWSFVENKNPLMRSGITLAFANDVWGRSSQDLSEDGIFTAKEAAGLDLSRTKLMVLSACETGLGDIRGSEGVYGLQRALQMAGVDNLIMSLWQVPDKETSEFMGLFYHYLVNSNSIKEAFHNTQVTMSQKYDPYFWGAFILVD